MGAGFARSCIGRVMLRIVGISAYELLLMSVRRTPRNIAEKAAKALRERQSDAFRRETFVPRLRRHGVTDSQIETMMIKNPARVFSRG